MQKQEQKIMKIVEEMINKNIFLISKDNIIEYLYDELQKERKINNEFYDHFNKGVNPEDIKELIHAYQYSIAVSTKLINRIVKENKELKQQIKYKHELNDCLMYVIELGGVKEDG